MKKLNVLLIAEASNPESSSIPLIGWAHSSAISKVANAHVITEARTRDAILRQGWIEGEEFTAIEAQAVSGPMFRLGEYLRGGKGKGWTPFTATGWTIHTALSAVSYYYFEHLVWKMVGERICAKEFDIVHRVTPLSPAVPSRLAAKCARAGVPFVLGPINGGLPWPKGFEEIRRQEETLISRFRWAHKFMPGYHSTRRNASAILVGSRATIDDLPRRYHGKAVYLPENGIDTERFSIQVERPVSRPLRIAFVGRLVALKGVDMLIDAAAPLIREDKVVLDIIGDGPEMPNLKAQVERLGLGSSARLEGVVEHDSLQERLVQSDIMALPSIHDFGGGVVLEAMALGLAPLVLDYGGPGELVTSETGYLIPMGDRSEIVENMRKVLAGAAETPDAVRTRGERSKRRIDEFFTWPAKAEQVLEVYNWVLGRSSSKPNFGMPLGNAC